MIEAEFELKSVIYYCIWTWEWKRWRLNAERRATMMRDKSTDRRIRGHA